MKPYIYLRGLRHIDLSVFCVESGQKSYLGSCIQSAGAFL